MDDHASEISEHEAPENNWTENTKAEEVGTWETVFQDEDGFNADCSMDIDDLEWEELKACRLHVTELEKQRDHLEIDIEREKQAENSAAVFRLRARHKCVCAEIQAEEELEAHLAMVLQEHETNWGFCQWGGMVHFSLQFLHYPGTHRLELCQVEIELGQYLGLRQEVEHEEKKLQALNQEKHSQRLQIEKSINKRAKLKALHAKNEQKKTLQEQVELKMRKKEQIQASRQKAAFFLKQTLERMREKEEEGEKMKKELIKRRTEAAESLKANIAASQEALRVRKLKQKACLPKLKEDENFRKHLLQEAGLNSIKLMHLHKAQEDIYRKQGREFQEKQKDKKIEIVSKLPLEEKQKEKLKKTHTLLIQPRVTQSMVLKRLEKLQQNVLPLSAHAERELIQERCSTRPVSSPASSRTGISSSLDSLQKLEASTRIEADWLMEKKEDQECLVQPEFIGLWDRKHMDYMVMIRIRGTDLCSYD
ncbi:cilia- and flagella-associated protein 74 isoform X2 [Silurus asotus]|uniref:Cilia- and flagella-associated protein 74 isoform X2 n=1 Tax=Silurus asotus TaxID=30991 RepID=A0AAD5FLT9_SILAS|nr:cilia- and flagella-associated protein 74 isoform X2 [Silurus asotus]